MKAAEEDDAARRRFGNAKSISSAQFEDNNDGFTDYENQVRVLHFASVIRGSDEVLLSL